VVAADAGASAVSWGAIFAGAAGAAALSLILLILGTGLGLSSVPPFSGQGAGATAFGVSTILWLSFTQLAASGIGGYLAGRLRTHWAGAQADEVYFRDTAHGFLAWGVATLLTAALLSSVIGSIVSGGAQAAASVAGTATTGATVATAAQVSRAEGSGSTDVTGYFVDSLFRRDASAAAASAPTAAPTATDPGSSDAGAQAASTAEAGRILTSALASGRRSCASICRPGSCEPCKTEDRSRIDIVLRPFVFRPKKAIGYSADCARRARRRRHSWMRSPRNVVISGALMPGKESRVARMSSWAFCC
jgi:hypothetical protein